MIRKLGVALLKLLTCMVGCGIAGVVICAFGGFHGYADDGLYIGWLMAGATFGIFVGISWIIKRRDVRTYFVVPSMLGLAIYLMLLLLDNRQPYSRSSYWHLIVLFLGLFIGIVGALAKAGAFSTQPNPESINHESGIVVSEEIRKLAELKSDGLLTEEEFELKKRELLDRL